MTERPLVLLRGLHSCRRLLKAMADTRRYQIVLFKNALSKPQLDALDAVTLESLQDETAVYATRLATVRARSNGRVLKSEALPIWLPPPLSEPLEEMARHQVPMVIELIEGIKALHRRQPIGSVVVHHDLNIWNSTALATANVLGIPTMHVSHTHTFGYIQSGLPHSAGSADVTAVWSEQCLADFPDAARYRHRLVATGTPEMDRYFQMRQLPARQQARAALGLSAELPVLTYASTYEETNSVSSAAHAGATWRAFRSFLKAYRPLAGEAHLVIKLHPSKPMQEEHAQILREEGVEAQKFVAVDEGETVAASDLLVSFFPSQVMVDALMLNTLSLWVKAFVKDYIRPFVSAPWLMQVEPEDFSSESLRSALLDAEYRRRHLDAFDAHRPLFNAGADGRAAERVMQIIDRMGAATRDAQSPWGQRYHAARELLAREARVVDLLRAMAHQN